MPAPKNQNLSTDEQSCGRFVSLLSFPLNVMSAVKVALVCVGANISYYGYGWAKSKPGYGQAGWMYESPDFPE